MSYLKFEDKGTSESGLTKRWVVSNATNSSQLGWIAWKATWRRYTFSPMPNVGLDFDAGCLNEIVSFLQNEMSKRG